MTTTTLPELLDSTRIDRLIDNAIASGIEGTIWSVGRNAIEAVALPVPMGAYCEIQRRAVYSAEVIGFSGSMTLLAPLDGADGISPGDKVRLLETSIMIPVGPEMLGRVFDAAGRAIDDLPQPRCVARVPLDNSPISAMQRPPISDVLTTGVRAIDAMLTLGRGQRVGIFAGSGVGKSTLLGMMSRGTDAEVIVIGLVGERGREVQEYLQRELDPKTRERRVTVVATSDQPALRRVQAAMAPDCGRRVFSRSRQRCAADDGLGHSFCHGSTRNWTRCREAPTTRGYPPSVFSMLPRLVERSGIGPKGSITGIYTVLVEGDDQNEPISDTLLRGLLDGHFVLSRVLRHQDVIPRRTSLAV